MLRQILMGWQWVPIVNPFHYCSVAVEGFLSNGTSMAQGVGKSIQRQLVVEENGMLEASRNGPSNTFLGLG